MADADLPTALIASLSDDPEVKAAVKALALDSVKALRYVLNRGAPALRLQVATRMLPGIVKALSESRADENADLKAAVDRFNAEVGAALGIEGPTEVPTDG